MKVFKHARGGGGGSSKSDGSWRKMCGGEGPTVGAGLPWWIHVARMVAGASEPVAHRLEANIQPHI